MQANYSRHEPRIWSTEVVLPKVLKTSSADNDWTNGPASAMKFEFHLCIVLSTGISWVRETTSYCMLVLLQLWKWHSPVVCWRTWQVGAHSQKRIKNKTWDRHILSNYNKARTAEKSRNHAPSSHTARLSITISTTILGLLASKLYK